MNPELNDQMVLDSQFYPAGIYNQFVPNIQDHAVGAVNSKPRCRQRRNKKEQSELRKRKLSEEQANRLEKSFESDYKLESERKDRLASELGLDPRQVAVWFQNRRARWRNKKLEEEYNKLKFEHENTVIEKCNLEAQVIKLKEQLVVAEKEIQRLSEHWDGLSRNSPSTSFSMEAIKEPLVPLFGEFGFENVFYMPQDNYVDVLGWDNLYYI